MTRGRPFEKGNRANPGGRKKVPKEIIEFKTSTYEDFIHQLKKYGNYTKEQMKADLERPDCTMFEHIFGKIVIQAAQGEKDARQVLLDRLWGRVKDQVQVLGDGTNLPQVVIRLPDNGRDQLNVGDQRIIIEDVEKPIDAQVVENKPLGLKK